MGANGHNLNTLALGAMVSGEVLSFAERDIISLLRDIKAGPRFGSITIQVREGHIETVHPTGLLRYTSNEMRVNGEAGVTVIG